MKAKLSSSLRKIGQSFGTKVFLRLTILILIITISFTAVFLYEQTRTLKQGIRNEGELFAQLVAHSLRLSIFSENTALMEDVLRTYLENKQVLSVTAFNFEGKLLIKKDRPRSASSKNPPQDESQVASVLKELRETHGQFYYRDSLNTFEIWTPVLSGLSYANEESMFFTEANPNVKRTIGYVRIVLDKSMLNRQQALLLVKGIFICLVFLTFIPAILYFMVKKVTKPLNKLTESVRAIEEGSTVEPLRVETNDEIGKLALAFNQMADSLKKKETEKQQLEGQLRQAQKMEAIGTLSGGIAHDFNNILSAIGGYGHLLRMGVEHDERLTSYADQIVNSVEKGATLTHSLLAFSRKQLIKVQPVKINDVVLSVEKILMRLIGEDIEFRTRLINRDLVIMADTGLIDQVLMNLTTNARDAMPGGGVLTIAAEYIELEEQAGFKKPGRYALLSVSDTGEGISEENKKRIFDPFFTTKEVGKGTGLGLAMVYGIVKQHEGYIEVESEIGKGTTFNIYLPLYETLVEEKRLEERNYSEQRQRPRSSETVLLAEDNEDVRDLSRRILEMDGYTVIEARDGEEAVSEFIKNKDKIHFLLFDLVMPKKNGYRAYEEIRQVNPDIKALFISGYSANIIYGKKILEGAMNYVSKPISPDTLLTEVRKVLDGGKTPI